MTLVTKDFWDRETLLLKWCGTDKTILSVLILLRVCDLKGRRKNKPYRYAPTMIIEGDVYDERLLEAYYKIARSARKYNAAFNLSFITGQEYNMPLLNEGDESEHE